MSSPIPPEGHQIREVRPLTEAEMEDEGWTTSRHGEGMPPLALVLENGAVLFPSDGTEGNNAGSFHVQGSISDLLDLAGHTLSGYRPMTEPEIQRFGWWIARFPPAPHVLVIDGGASLVFIAEDAALNGPGVLFEVSPDGVQSMWF